MATHGKELPAGHDQRAYPGAGRIHRAGVHNPAIDSSDNRPGDLGAASLVHLFVLVHGRREPSKLT